MKTEELNALGLSEEQTKAVLTLHGKDIEAHKSALSKAEGERDSFKTQIDSLQGQLTTANAAIEKFGDATPESIETLKADVEKYKADAEAAEARYTTDITQRNQKAWLEENLNRYGVSSPYARQSLVANIMDEKEGLPWRNDSFYGFDDFMKAAKEKDNSLYLTEEEKKAAEAASQKAENAPSFAAPTGSDGKNGTAFTVPKIF